MIRCKVPVFYLSLMVTPTSSLAGVLSGGSVRLLVLMLGAWSALGAWWLDPDPSAESKTDMFLFNTTSFYFLSFVFDLSGCAEPVCLYKICDIKCPSPPSQS